MQKHSDNAKAVAEYLAGHDKVTWVSYAGLPGDRYYNLAQKYCPKGAGAVLTFGVEGGNEAGIKMVSSRCELFSHLANIGDTRSLIIHPVLDDAQPAHRGGSASPPARGRTSSACRSASRTSPTSSPTSTRRSPRCERRAGVSPAILLAAAPRSQGLVRPPCAAAFRRTGNVAGDHVPPRRRFAATRSRWPARTKVTLTYRARIAEALDAGHGECLLRDSAIAEHRRGRLASRGRQPI